MKKYPFTKQNDLKDCGPASLSMIIKYYGGYISLEQLNQLIKTDKNGSNAYNIIEAAKKLGFDATGLKIPLQDLNTIVVPFIAYTIIDNSYSHFIVVYQIDYKNKLLIIGDPSKKVYKVSFDYFNSIYQNIVLTFYPIHKIPIYKEQKYLQKSIKKIILKNYKIFIILILISLFITLLSLSSSLYLKAIIDNHFSNNYLVKLFIIFLIITMLKNTTEYVQNKIYIFINQKIDLILTTDVFSKLILLPYSYYKNKTTGDVVARFNDITKIKDFISKILIILFVDSILSITSIICLFLISKILSLIILLVSFIIIIIILLYKKIFITNLNILKNKQSDINSFVIESIMGFETIKGLSLEKNFINNFNDNYNNYLFKYKKLSKLQNKENYYKNLIYDIGLNLIILLGSLLIYYNVISIGNLVLFITLTSFFLNPIKSIVENYELFRETKISINRINELILEDKQNNKQIKISNIEVKNLNYYHNDKLILENINLSIKQKDKIVLIGESGGGKSTMLKLLKGYYNTNNIYYNGVNSINHDSISYISQNEILFTNTIYNNITLGRKINNDDFKKVCDICLINEIVEKNRLGFNTLIEENGFNLSGGEKQRIILARTLLNNSDVILIDEGLSEIDLSKERTILKNILQIYKDKIIIIVTHRMDNIDLFNKLLKVEDKHIEVIIKSK